MSASHADLDSVVREFEPVPRGPLPSAAPAGAPAAVLALQRASGNQAVSRYLARRRGLIDTGELASRWNRARAERPMHPGRPEVCFRIPDAATITAMLASKEVPEDKLKASIQLALERMAKERELKSQAPIADVMSRLFPSPGKFDEAEFANVVDVADRTKIYEKASDAESKLSKTDQIKVEAAMDEAKKLIDRASTDTVNLARVFGSKAGEAKTVYENASTAIVNLKANVATHIETDYNLDAMQTGLGGYALFTKQLVHLNPQVVASMDPNDLVITLVHECSHLADKTVKDKGYYESANWDALDDDVKVTNAAHYEEIPRRYLKKSIYADDQEFKPGTSASGNAVTFETEVRRMVDEYGRTCHASAQEIHVRLRQIHVKLQTGDRQAFDANEPLILDISKVFKLTIHDRAHPRTITTLDLSLSEGVAHAAWKFKAVAKAQAFPTQPDPGKDAKHHARRVLSAALKAYGTVTGNDADDRELFKWLFTNKTKLKV